MKYGRYIYGVINTNEKIDFGVRGIGEHKAEVYTITHNDIAAVVSPFPTVPFNSLPKETILLYLAIYQSVIEEVMKSYYIIPLKFGTVAVDEEEARDILEQGYPSFKTALHTMAGKIELDVVALWSQLNEILQEIGRKEEIKRVKEERAANPFHQAYEDMIKVGQMVKAALDEQRSRTNLEIVTALKECATDFRSHDLLDDSMIMNAAFLLDTDKERVFEQEVHELNARYAERINFRVVGPLPPYSFSTLEIKKLGFEVINEARKTLGLGEEATLSEIKRAYRQLTQNYHPDKHPGNLEVTKQFGQINKAYKILMDCVQSDYCSFIRPVGKEVLLVGLVDRPDISPDQPVSSSRTM